MSKDKSVIKGSVAIHGSEFTIIQKNQSIHAKVLEDSTSDKGIRTLYLDRRIHDEGENEVDGLKVKGVYTSILSKQIVRSNESGQGELF